MTTWEVIQRNDQAIARADELLAWRWGLSFNVFSARRNAVPAPGPAGHLIILHSAPQSQMQQTHSRPKASRSFLARLFEQRGNRRAHRLARWLAVSPQFKRLD